MKMLHIYIYISCYSYFIVIYKVIIIKMLLVLEICSDYLVALEKLIGTLSGTFLFLDSLNKT